MSRYTKSDRKQVFGAEELDDRYMFRIKQLCEERVRALTLGAGDGSLMRLE